MDQHYLAQIKSKSPPFVKKNITKKMTSTALDIVCYHDNQWQSCIVDKKVTKRERKWEHRN